MGLALVVLGLLPVVLTFGAIDALVPVLIIIILIAAAATLTRGWNALNMFGIGFLAGVAGQAGNVGTLRGKSTFTKGKSPGRGYSRVLLGATSVGGQVAVRSQTRAVVPPKNPLVQAANAYVQQKPRGKLRMAVSTVYHSAIAPTYHGAVTALIGSSTPAGNLYANTKGIERNATNLQKVNKRLENKDLRKDEIRKLEKEREALGATISKAAKAINNQKVAFGAGATDEGKFVSYSEFIGADAALDTAVIARGAELKKAEEQRTPIQGPAIALTSGIYDVAKKETFHEEMLDLRGALLEGKIGKDDVKLRIENEEEAYREGKGRYSHEEIEGSVNNLMKSMESKINSEKTLNDAIDSVMSRWQHSDTEWGSAITKEMGIPAYMKTYVESRHNLDKILNDTGVEEYTRRETLMAGYEVMASATSLAVKPIPNLVGAIFNVGATRIWTTLVPNKKVK